MSGGMNSITYTLVKNGVDQSPVIIGGRRIEKVGKMLLDGVEQRPTSPRRLAHLMRVVRDLHQVRGRTLRMLEIGSLRGDSALSLSAYGSLVCVDVWPHEQVFSDFQERTRGLDIRAIQGDSRHVLPLLDPAFDVIYVDGCHTWPVVDADLAQAKRLIAEDGIICGDDLEYVITSDDDARRVEPFKCIDYMLREQYHPGVSLAVYRAFGSHVKMRDGFWWVKR